MKKNIIVKRKNYKIRWKKNEQQTMTEEGNYSKMVQKVLQNMTMHCIYITVIRTPVKGWISCGQYKNWMLSCWIELTVKMIRQN